MTPTTPAPVSAEHNPLRDPDDKRLPRIAGPCSMVMFGVTGDLARKKLMPAIYDLASRGLLPPGFSLVGFARREWADQDFAQVVHDSVRAHARTEFREEVWRSLAEGFRFVPGAFDDPQAFELLARTVRQLDEERGTGGNHAFYLSIPPAWFAPVCSQLQASGLSDPQPGTWRRVVIEKPFGHDLASAQELNAIVEGVFPPDSVFRIDHYLGKETVQNLMAIRFGNAIFEPLWNRAMIDHVQITAAEDLGLEGRAGYYEEAGVIRDMLQNHLLQLFALTAMEPPVAFDAGAIRDEKVKVLRAVRPIPAGRVPEVAVRGQYGPGTLYGEAVPGYREEPGVKESSTTPTYVAVKLEVDNWRWQGVPFFLRTGKRLPKKVTEIAVVFKRPPLGMFPGGLERNVLAFRIQPDEGVSLKFSSKSPGQEMVLREVVMDFRYDAFGAPLESPYSRLLLDAMLGDATLFPREDEVDCAWQLVSGLLETAEGTPPQDFPNYPAGTWGPEAADELIGPDRRWRRL